MNMTNFWTAIIFGIPTGLGLTFFIVSFILSKNTLGKKENTFKTYSRLPIRILKEDECSTFLGPDSGIYWRGVKEQMIEKK